MKDLLLAGVGPICVLLGIFINEYFRRKNRDSLCAEKLFLKKLELYEELHDKMLNAHRVAVELQENNKLSEEEIHEVWGNVVLPLAEFLDGNGFYIDEGIKFHCMLTVIGVEDFIEAGKEITFEKWREAIDLMKQDSGISRVNKFFTELNKPKLQSDYISIWKEKEKSLQKKQDASK